MHKYKLTDGTIVDTSNYSTEKLAFFHKKYPDAVLVEDFQIDSANATDPRVESGNTGSTSEEDFSVSRLGNAEVQLDEFGNQVTIKAWEEETKDYIDKNPDLTADELSKWINRPGGPTESQYSFQEEKEIFEANKEDPKLDNPNYSPSNFIIGLYEDPGFNKNKPALSAYDNELEFLKNKQKDYSIMSTESADIQSQINQLEYNKENELENNRTATSRARNSFTQKINEADTYWNDNQAKFQSGEITPEEFATVERNYNNKRENIFQNSYEKDRYEEQTLLLDEISTAKTKDTYSSFGSSDLGESKEEQIKFDQKVEDEIINKLYSDNKLKGKTLDGNLNLEGKEMLITEAKSKVLNQAYEDYLTEYNKAQEIIFASEESATIIPEVANAAQSILYKAANNLQATSTKLAFNIGEQSFDNNFQMTEDFIEWRDRHIDGGFVGGTQDFIGTLVQGGQKIIGESIAGSAIWLNRLAFTGMGTFEEDEYSRLDMVSDMFSNYNSFNYMGVSPKGGSLSEDGISFRSASKTIANMLPFTIGVALAARKGDMKGLKNAYSVLRGMGASASTINKIKMGGFAFRATVNDNYMEGKQMGLDDAQALAYSSMTSTATAVVQGIMPDVNFFKTNVGKSMLSTVAENLKKATTKEARKAVGKQFVNNLLGEIGEEEAELLLQDMAKITVGLSNETKFTDFDTQFETIGGTILLAGGTSTVMAPAQFSNFKNKIYNQYRTQGADIIKTLQESKKVVETKLKRARTQQSKDAAQRQLDEINSAIEYGGDIIKAINVAPDVMNDEQIDLLIQKNQLLDKKAKADKRYTKGVDTEIEAIDAKIEASQVKQQSSIIEEKTEAGTKKIADALGITFTKGNTQEITELIAKENVAITERNIEKKDEDKEDLIGTEEALAQNGFIIQNEDGTQSIVVNEDVAGTNKAVTTAQHELLHGVLLKTITDNPGTIIQMSNALKSEIDKMIPTGVSFNNSYIQGRLEAYKEKPSSVQAEELLTIFSEGLTQGYISFEENAFTKIGDFIRQGLQKAGMNVTFNSGRDVFNFIKDFNKSVISGKGLGKGLTKAAKRGVKVGKKLGNTSAFLYDANFEANIKAVYNDTKIDLPKRALKIAIAYRPRMQELMNKSSNSVFGTSEKFQATEYALIGKNNANSILNTVLNYNPSSDISLDETIGRTIFGIGETAVTQKYSREADKAKIALDNIPYNELQSRAAQYTIATELPGMVKAQIIGRFNISKQARQDFIDVVVEKMYLGKETTRWGTTPKGEEMPSKGTLYGFLNGRIDLRIKDVVREEYKRNPGERIYLAGIDTNQFETLEKAANVVAEETVIKEDNKPVFKKLIPSKVISTEALVNIKNKVLSTVRTLKTAIDSNTSINKTVSPLIAEIKKEMGKQADIDLKKEMGGKKDDQLKKFLLSGKKAILQNMTTTWLMGAMPGAVQKRVDGTWTSNWKGKKIDRESVKDNNAGRTSGADMVRRDPNVTSMPDAEFLGYILDSKGDPIRGRKESLAKAMAEEISLEVFNQQLEDKDSNISKAFESNQALKGVVLADNYIAEVAKQSERGNVKFSLTPRVADIILKNEKIIKDGIFSRFSNGDVITKNRLAEVLSALNLDLTPKEIKNFVEQAENYIKRFIDQSDKTENVGFADALIDAINSNNVLTRSVKFLTGIDLRSLGVTSQAGLFRSMFFVGAHRKLMSTYISTLNKEGAIRFLKWHKGHTATAGASAFLRKRNQITKGSEDLMNLMNEELREKGIVFSGTQGKNGFVITTVTENGVSENIKDKLTTPEQAATKQRVVNGSKSTVNISKKDFENEGVHREAMAKEAKDELLAWLSFVKKEGTVVDWVMTMMSLKSNMGSMLKAAASVKYYVKDGYENGLNRYEHLISTDTMVRYLTAHFFGIKKIDLDILFDKYKVAIIPIKMDNDLNVFRQNSMGVWDYLTQLATDRYYGKPMYGYKNIVPIEVIVGEDKGNIIGEEFVSFNSILKEGVAKTVAENIVKDKALANGRSVKMSLSPKKIRVFDFDDTLARTKSNVLYTMPDGTTGKIDAATFAKDAGKMEAEGAVWDFSEFSKVMNGKAGPLLGVAKIIADKKGAEDIFVLTARPADAAGPIKAFLAELGLDIPLKNITGLGDGASKAKANWMISKVAEGYNDFYFADDHTGNVKAVKDILDTFDVKGKVQLAKVKFSKSLDPEFNLMIERTKGIESVKEFSKIVAKRKGASIGRYKFLVPAAEDFRGLTSYTFAGKGKQGEADQKFFEDALITPYFRGVNAIGSERQTVKNDFRALSKLFKPTVKKLGKLIPDGDFTYDQAVRVYLWTQAGIEVPGLSKRDQAKLNKLVNKDAELVAFANAALLSSKKDTWIEPGDYWDTKTMLSDLNDLTEKVNRKEHLAEFIENVDIIFSEKNLNKVEATYGTRHRGALEDAIYAMKNGTNRTYGTNKITNRWNNWVNSSIGAIMFFNRRSATMQLLSTVNFINWSDNNPIKAGAAFANQPQYWKDFAMIFNSDKLKQRRGGLKSDIQESEIANAAKGSKDNASAILSYLLKIGFTPTQIADSFAISMGGASMYRNRVETYKKQGLDEKVAEEKAWLDFTKISDETQQSGDPILVSQQQRSVAGRLILSFQNTTMQYNRLMKKSAQDLVNRRGDPKTHISQIIYYGAVQNFIFNALSTSLFALIPGFDDDDDETDEAKQNKEDKKAATVLNGMMDSLLRGTGIYGAVIAAVKNTIRKYYSEEEKGFTANHAYTLIEAANLSPAIGSKLRKLHTAMQTNKFEKDVIEKRGWDVTIDGKYNLSPKYSIVGDLAAASLNIPLDRAIAEAQSVAEVLDDRNTKWQRIALVMGWRTWNVGATNEEHDLIKADARVIRKEEGKEKAKNTRDKNKEIEKQKVANLTPEQRQKEARDKALAKREKAIAKRKAKYAEMQNK